MDTVFWLFFTAINFTIVPKACLVYFILGLKRKVKKQWILALAYPVLSVAVYGWSISPNSKQFRAFETIERGMNEETVISKIEDLNYKYVNNGYRTGFYIWKSRGIPYWHFFIDMKDGKVEDTDFETFGL